MSDNFQYLIVKYLVDDLMYTPLKDNEAMLAHMQAWIYSAKDVPFYKGQKAQRMKAA